MERYEYLNGPPAPRMVAELAMRHDVLVKQLADAQATIAALQARLDERLEFIKDCDIALDRIQAPHTNEGQEELVSTWRRIELVGSLLSQYRSTLEQMSTQLTQRTAELEAANKLLYRKNCALGRAETIINDLQAELERVKQALCDADERANEYQKALHDFESERALPLSIELERVRGLIAEYAKAKTDFDEKRLQEDHYAGKERYNRLVEAENALLQHRQGLEG